jgi:hypothetical protein
MASATPSFKGLVFFGVGVGAFVGLFVLIAVHDANRKPDTSFLSCGEVESLYVKHNVGGYLPTWLSPTIRFKISGELCEFAADQKTWSTVKEKEKYFVSGYRNETKCKVLHLGIRCE